MTCPSGGVGKYGKSDLYLIFDKSPGHGFYLDVRNILKPAQGHLGRLWYTNQSSLHALNWAYMLCNCVNIICIRRNIYVKLPSFRPKSTPWTVNESSYIRSRNSNWKQKDTFKTKFIRLTQRSVKAKQTKY